MMMEVGSWKLHATHDMDGKMDEIWKVTPLTWLGSPKQHGGCNRTIMGIRTMMGNTQYKWGSYSCS